MTLPLIVCQVMMLSTFADPWLFWMSGVGHVGLCGFKTSFTGFLLESWVIPWWLLKLCHNFLYCVPYFCFVKLGMSARPLVFAPGLLILMPIKLHERKEMACPPYLFNTAHCPTHWLIICLFYGKQSSGITGIGKKQASKFLFVILGYTNKNLLERALQSVQMWHSLP